MCLFQCPAGYFGCFSGAMTCIEQAFVCDCSGECDDGSDEDEKWAGCPAGHINSCIAKAGAGHSLTVIAYITSSRRFHSIHIKQKRNIKFQTPIHRKNHSLF